MKDREIINKDLGGTMPANVTVWIDKKEISVPAETTILDAAKMLGIKIPTLCHHQDLNPTGNCGICVVEVEGSPAPKRACCTPVYNGLKVTTNSKKLRSLRKTILELTLSNHDVKCPTCVANGKCELQDLTNNMDIDSEALPTILLNKPLDQTSISIVRDVNKCISCGRCVTVCNEIQTVSALTFANRGFDGHIDTAFGKGMGNSSCVNCGQCVVYCPTGALREKSEIEEVWNALLDNKRHVVVQEAPAIRATLAEEFGMEPYKVSVGKMYAALKALGFDAIFDTNFTADLTIMEEGTELINRITTGGKLPLVTSCSPGWIKFMETFFPDLADYISTCKSPQQMFGALAKTYYPEVANIDPATITSVSIMPCTAKKFEAKRPEMNDSGYQDVDHVLTTREFVRMIKEAGIDFKNLEEQKADELMGMYTGAATIFGATGGVMEAAVRSAYYLLNKKNLPKLELHAVRGMTGIKEAELEVTPGLTVKIAVAHGLGNARKLMTKVREQIEATGKSEYHFIEIMACSGGCVGGGGQPFGSGVVKRAARGQGLYAEDTALKVRCSHENAGVMKLYEKFLEAPGSHKAHKLLHTNYYKRSEHYGNVTGEATHKH